MPAATRVKRSRGSGQRTSEIESRSQYFARPGELGRVCGGHTPECRHDAQRRHGNGAIQRPRRSRIGAITVDSSAGRESPRPAARAFPIYPRVMAGPLSNIIGASGLVDMSHWRARVPKLEDDFTGRCQHRNMGLLTSGHSGRNGDLIDRHHAHSRRQKTRDAHRPQSLE